MGYYENIRETSQKELDDFPPIDVEKCTEETNRLFKPYVFMKKQNWYMEIWTSCCMQHRMEDRYPRTVDGRNAFLLYGSHNDKISCPYCGRPATLKEVCRLGRRKKIEEYQPVIFLSEQNGDLFARAYWARKDYQRELDAPPLFMLTAAYRFGDGFAEIIEEEPYSGGELFTRRLEGNLDPVHRVIHEPFTEGSGMMWHYVGYHLFGQEAIADSRFRYCRYADYRVKKGDIHYDTMKYFAACALYPRQIEMLMKGGFTGLVEDLVSGRRKNSRIITWGENDPCKAFRLDRQELKAYMALPYYPRKTDLIYQYRRLRQAGMPTSFAELDEIHEALSYETDSFVSECKKRKIKPMRLLRYLKKFTGPRCYGGYFDVCNAWPLWRDTINMCEALGYDTRDEAVLFPKELELKHDEVAREQNLKLEREQAEKDAQLRKEQQEGHERRRKKYNFELGGYFIRIAEDPEEIIREGKTLQHCVGGYAERHMKGSTTILFLRRCETPGASLYTIEMMGERLVQIHGYKNERDGAANPRTKMAWMLDPWLDWIERGSPRKKDGSPKLRKTKIKEAKTA